MEVTANAATFTEIVEYLKTVPAASPSWAQGLYSASLSIASISRLVSTMAQDASSPLREAEEGVLSKEIMRLNQDMGFPGGSGVSGGKFSVRVKAVLSPGEQSRVVRAVSGFAQPVFVPSGRFGKNGHAIMNAVRRVQASYLTSRIPVGASVVEVGPDVVNWLLSESPAQWGGVNRGAYAGARPSLTPRDVVRMNWENVANLVLKHKDKFFSADVVEKAKVLSESYAYIFPGKKIQQSPALGEYIISYDSNYDIKFSDMPVAMGACGSRAWYGCLVRAKGLTRSTRKLSGSLDLLGVHYRVDWEAGRIDFRHPECQAFGYSHDVWEYMKYEEYNGYVWTTDSCHYVYAKGPETTSELLFFNVVRVPKVHRMYEPRFVESPFAGQLELTSLWAVGDEINGVPTSFETVRFHVDQLNFSKVLEKRRALDCKGNLSVTLSLVRSTNVRMWLHGTPVSANKRIEAKLAEATAVVVESLAAENRLNTNLVFDVAMEQYDLCLPRAGWLRRMLEGIIDMKAVSGSVAGPIMRMWNDMRSVLIDKALSSLSQVRVGVSCVDAHIQLAVSYGHGLDGEHAPLYRSACRCAEIAEVAAAMEVSKGVDKQILEAYHSKTLGGGICAFCVPKYGDFATVNVTTVTDVADDSGISDCTSESSTDIVLWDSWRDEAAKTTFESRSMHEFVELEQYLAKAQIVECRVDATRIFSRGPVSDGLLQEFSTARTRHVVLEFVSGRCVRRYGSNIGILGAVYDLRKDAIIPVRVEGDVMYAAVVDGYYYSCNRLKVWNGLDLVAAVSYAMDYGSVGALRARYFITLGVPGSGKTYGMMKKLSEDVAAGIRSFLVLAVTRASVAAAKVYGKAFGIPDKLLDARVMTLDRYLMHMKFTAEVLCVDEFPMVHVGKVDAAVSISAATTVRLCGDARQIPYDPFCAEFNMQYATLRDSVDVCQVVFLPESHRLTYDACAMWLDQYPAIYPCECCRVGEKDRSSFSVQRVTDMGSFTYDPEVRYHTYKQDERDQLLVELRMPGDAVTLREKLVGGLATVHEDQGSTHDDVVTVRLSVDYDKNASSRNPSLYNRERYVLTDTTRHKRTYTYVTMCPENDLIIRRVGMAQDIHRLQLVREHEGLGVVDLIDML